MSPAMYRFMFETRFSSFFNCKNAASRSVYIKLWAEYLGERHLRKVVIGFIARI